ncbi:uncharacterized protein [Elaeis guineensis]
MQILRWMLKLPRDHLGVASTRGRSNREPEDELKPRDLVIYDRDGAPQSWKEELEEKEDEEENKRTFTILTRREDGRTCLYSTLQLKHLRSLYKNQNFWQPENSELRMGHKAESANVGFKVLPICDAVSTGCNGGGSSDGSEKDAHKGQQRKAVSRMKELLRWAAAAKSHKGGSKGWKVLYFRKRVDLKAQVDDSSSNSSKVSFRWDVGGCSTSSSVHSPIASMSRNDQMWMKNSSNPSAKLQSSECDANMLVSSKSEEYVRTGHWITTDSDFVVLEL